MRFVLVTVFRCAAGCSSSHGVIDGGGSDARSTPDSGGFACGAASCAIGQTCCGTHGCWPAGMGCPPGPIDDAGVALVCGDHTCASGEYCCNASCGTCAPIGADCIAIECSDAGPVSPPADCRVHGCPSGESCQPCWADYACLPLGAIC